MKRIIVTNHARQRFKERFYNLAFRLCHQEYDSAMLYYLRNASKCMHWKQSPFYVNKLRTMHKKINIEVYKRNGVYFVVDENDDRLIILTVVKSFLFE